MKMKKIMMLVAAALLAGFAQAAFVDWNASGLTSYKSGTFYLFEGSKSADVLSALASVDDSTASKIAGMALTSGSVTTKGKATANGTDVGTATSVFALVMAGSEFADGVAYTTITEDVSKMLFTPPASSPGNFTSTIATAGKAGTMSASAGGGVPEPTSGLLLLIGGAMLALRRKQK